MKEIREVTIYGGDKWIADVADHVAYYYVEAHPSGQFLVADLKRFHLLYEENRIDSLDSYDQAYGAISNHLAQWKRSREHPGIAGSNHDLGKWKIVDTRPDLAEAEEEARKLEEAHRAHEEAQARLRLENETPLELDPEATLDPEIPPIIAQVPSERVTSEEVPHPHTDPPPPEGQGESS